MKVYDEVTRKLVFEPDGEPLNKETLQKLRHYIDYHDIKQEVVIEAHPEASYQLYVEMRETRESLYAMEERPFGFQILHRRHLKTDEWRAVAVLGEQRVDREMYNSPIEQRRGEAYDKLMDALKKAKSGTPLGNFIDVIEEWRACGCPGAEPVWIRAPRLE